MKDLGKKVLWTPGLSSGFPEVRRLGAADGEFTGLAVRAPAESPASATCEKCGGPALREFLRIKNAKGEFDVIQIRCKREPNRQQKKKLKFGDRSDMCPIVRIVTEVKP